MDDREIDKKVLTRVRRLLAMAAADSGASEQEALFAAEKAREMMAAHGITNATVEFSGGIGETRVRDRRRGAVSKTWHREIMRALAKQSFVTADWHTKFGDRPAHWDLFGRESAVVTVRIMHEYLVKTVDRAARERNTPADEVFKEAMGTRIAERLEVRHERAMYDQKQAAQESNSRAQQSSSTNALVVVLEDYAQKECDLNEDMRLGLEPGTTAENRRQRELDRQRAQAEKQAERKRLLEAGIEEDVVEFMMWGYSEQEALKLARAPKPVETEEEKAKRLRRQQREDQEWREKYEKRQSRESARMRSPSYRAGRAAGDSVGLDAQVNKTERRKLT